jgi:FlaG/FlaF family flagellin (archaellin)
MRKITPVMLVLLLVASLMANIDIVQLETNEVVEDTGARSGADADLVAITSPKETVCEPTCRNELFVGQDTTFEVFIQNSGDTAITELGYKAQVWNSDGNGNPLNIAKDSSGNDLEWDNPDVICDDTTVCDDQSLAAGSTFKGGKTMIQYFGANAVWTPLAGIYVVQIEVYSDQDVEATNDVQQVYVEVRDYLDIEVDISWDDGSTVATGAGAKAFTVTVQLNGSSDFITHDSR